MPVLVFTWPNAGVESTAFTGAAGKNMPVTLAQSTTPTYFELFQSTASSAVVPVTLAQSTTPTYFELFQSTASSATVPVTLSSGH